MENLTQVIAHNLQYLRQKNNLTQQQLAERINYSDNAVSRWERAEATPNVETLKEIAHLFGIKVIDLLDEDLQKKREPRDVITKVRRIFVILFSVSIVWTFALIGFVYSQMFSASIGPIANHGWLLFVLSVPLSDLVLYYYNRLWGNKIYHLAIFSVFWLSLLSTIYLFILFLTGNNLWLIFMLGIPILLAQVLWFFTR